MVTIMRKGRKAGTPEGGNAGRREEEKKFRVSSFELKGIGKGECGEAGQTDGQTARRRVSQNAGMPECRNAGDPNRRTTPG